MAHHQYEEIQTLLERHFETLSKEYRNLAEERQKMQVEKENLLLQLQQCKMQCSRLELENKQLKQFSRNSDIKPSVLGIRKSKTNPLLPTNPLSQSTPAISSSSSSHSESSKFKENLDAPPLSQSKRKQLYYLQKSKLLDSFVSE